VFAFAGHLAMQLGLLPILTEDQPVFSITCIYQ
jgi:hypothetical protein